ncbi:hypothetical protein DFJ73DRAFT_840685 [Zopfochytrium polystomum]|nr:hypothetical protein DFJ73DRAFT_840685 [Zopfochytrium polystomum]
MSLHFSRRAVAALPSVSDRPCHCASVEHADFLLRIFPHTGLDEEMQNYLWPHILRLDQLDFVVPDVDAPSGSNTPAELDGNRKRAKGKDGLDKAAADAKAVFKELFKAELSTMTQSQIKERYGNALKVIATEDSRRIVLTGVNDQTIRISPLLNRVLEAVSGARETGITQADLAKVLNMDSRSLFYQVKNLCKMKLIVKMPLVTKGTFTSLCLHVKFAYTNPSFLEYERSLEAKALGQIQQQPSESGILSLIDTDLRYVSSDPASSRVSFHSELLRQRLTMLLQNAKNNVMLIHDLMRALLSTKFTKFERRWFNRTIESLARDGYVERINVVRQNVADRCVRLLRPYFASATGVGVTNFQASSRPTPAAAIAGASAPPRRYFRNPDPESTVTIGEGGYLSDLPFEAQVYRLIDMAGEGGTTSNIIRRSLGNITPRILEKATKKLQTPPHAPNGVPLIFGEGEFKGRERRYRYFSAENMAKRIAATGQGDGVSATQALANIVVRPSPRVRAKVNPTRPPRRRPIIVHIGSKPKRQKLDEDAEDEEEVSEEEEEEEEADFTSEETDGDFQETGASSKVPVRRSERAKTRGRISFAEDDDEDEIMEEPELPAVPPPPLEVPTFVSQLDEILCDVCRVDRDDDKMLLCDHCDKGRHTFCSDPPLESIPEGDWFCSEECKLAGKKVVEFLPPIVMDPPPPPPNSSKRRPPGGGSRGGDASTTSSKESTKRKGKGRATVPKASSKSKPTKSAKAAKEANVRTVKSPVSAMRRTRRQLLSDDTPEEQPEEQGAKRRKVSLDGIAVVIPVAPSATSPPEEPSGHSHGGSSPSGGSTPILELDERPRLPPVTTMCIPSSDSEAPITGSSSHAGITVELPAVATVTDESDKEMHDATVCPPKHPELAAPVEESSFGITTDRSSVENPQGSTGGTSDKPPLVPVPKKYAFTSKNAIARRQHFLQLIEEHRVLEVGYIFLKNYQAILDANNDTGAKYTIDKKTVIRTALSMEGEGLLKVLEVQTPHLNGSFSRRTLLLRKDVEPESPEVKNFINELKNKVFLGRTSEVPKIYIPEEKLQVERLGELQKRLRHQPGSGGSSSKDAPAQESSLADDTFSDPISRRQHTQPSTFWMPVALHYGFISAKMIRVRALHEWLCECATASAAGSSETERPPFMFQIPFLCRDLPLELYLKIVGNTSKCEALDEYIASGDLKVSMRNLPVSLRQAMDIQMHKTRTSVTILLKLMEQYSLVTVTTRTPLPPPVVSQPPPTAAFDVYRLNEVAVLLDYRLQSEPPIGRFNVFSPQQFSQFWTQLEFIWLEVSSKDVRKRKRSPNGREKQPPRPQTKKVGFREMMTAVRNWRPLFPYTPAQTMVLESYADRKHGLTPLSNEEELSKIASETGLNMLQVKGYYNRLVASYYRNALLVSERRRRYRLEQLAQEEAAKTGTPTTPSSATGSNATNVAPTQPAASKTPRTRRSASSKNSTPSTTEQGTAPSQTPVEKQRKEAHERGRRRVKDVLERAIHRKNDTISGIIPTVGDEAGLLAAANIRKRQRYIWSESEDLDIFLGHTLNVALIQLRGGRYSWAPVGRAAKMDPLICRRRINILLKSPANGRLLKGLVAEWFNVIKEGIASGALQEMPGTEYTSMDYTEFVSYFKAKTNAQNLRQLESIGLNYHPISADDTSKVKATRVDHAPIEVLLDDEVTLRAKMSILYANGLYAGLDEELTPDVLPQEAPPNTSAIRCLVFMSAAKMVLMTPQAIYDSTVAFNLLQQFARSTTEVGVNRLSAESTLVKMKATAIDRPLPGRRLSLSDRFLSSIAGFIPEKIPRLAVEFSKNAASKANGAAEFFDAMADSGSVCALLDFLILGKAILSPVWDVLSVSPELQPMIVINYLSEMTAEPPPQLDKKVVDGKRAPLPSNDENIKENVMAAVLEACDGSVDLVDTAVWPVFNWVEEAGSAGITLYDLKAAANGLMSDRLLLRAIAILSSVTVPDSPQTLIERVGHEDLRFVTYTNISVWYLNLPRRETEPESLEYPSGLLPQCRGRLWFSIHGELIGSVLRACLEMVISLIVEKPGIYEGKIFRRLRHVVTRVELAELLDVLTKVKACRRTSMIRAPAFTSLMDALSCDRPALEPCDDDIISTTRVTCYYAEPEWFKACSLIARETNTTA